MTSFLFNTTLLLLLTLLSFSSAFLIDLDGDEIRNGRFYYVIVRSSETGLIYESINSRCPQNIVAAYTGVSVGARVRIFTPLKKAFQFLDTEDRVQLNFVYGDAKPWPCGGMSTWGRTLNPYTERAYITTGGLRSSSFKIVKNDTSSAPTYLLQYCGSSADEQVCSALGFFGNHLLGITTPEIIVSFKKGYTVLQTSTS